jgi:hypothetical protein
MSNSLTDDTKPRQRAGLFLFAYLGKLQEARTPAHNRAMNTGAHPFGIGRARRDVAVVDVAVRHDHQESKHDLLVRAQRRVASRGHLTVARLFMAAAPLQNLEHSL